MTKAENTDTTPTASIPSIHTLGCALAVVNAEHARLDEQGCRGAPLDLLEARENALYKLIATLPADTLAVAAVQVGVAATLVGFLAACEWKTSPSGQTKCTTICSGSSSAWRR